MKNVWRKLFASQETCGLIADLVMDLQVVFSVNLQESEPSCQRNNVCAHFAERGSGKPTTASYIDESSEPNSKYSKKKKR